MTQDIEQFKRIEEIFESVIRLPPSERQEYLEQACKGDRQLLEEVKSLLDEDARCEIDSPTQAIKNKIEQTVAGRLMALDAGTKLGPYEILSLLGAGGMGEVYLATDSKLDRKVAIKVLPETMTRDRERVARFEREAKLLASLNHPNIAAVHGFDASDGTRFLVMEYVEGETLGSHLKNGAVAVEDALDIAKQIAEALEAAHEQGVIHRDLKPANVMIREDGTVKVLDFGLAKAMSDEPSGGADANSPTITANYTRPGVVLGTAAYMSPEQARGKVLDKRTDIW